MPAPSMAKDFEVAAFTGETLEVVRASGPPQLRLHGEAAARAARMGVESSLLTLTHSDALAIAQVLLLGK